MSTYLKSILLFIIFIISCQSVKAQHTEAGLVAKASSGFIYGPIFNARPLYKWGSSFENVRTLRAERTYLHYSQYGGNQYGSASAGGFFGQEWRKEVRAGLYLIKAQKSVDTIQPPDPICLYNPGSIINLECFTVSLPK